MLLCQYIPHGSHSVSNVLAIRKLLSLFQSLKSVTSCQKGFLQQYSKEKRGKVESKDGPTGMAAQQKLNNQRILITGQISKVAPQWKHIDELFDWLSMAFVQQLDIQAVQFWSLKTLRPTQAPLELRSMVYRNPALHPSTLVNPQIVQAVEYVLSERRGVMPQLVERVFAPAQVDTLHHYQLNYWAGYYLSSVALLPPPQSASSAPAKTLPPLRVVVSLFFQFPPHLRLMPTLSYILEQAISIAKQQGLLLT